MPWQSSLISSFVGGLLGGLVGAGLARLCPRRARPAAREPPAPDSGREPLADLILDQSDQIAEALAQLRRGQIASAVAKSCSKAGRPRRGYHPSASSAGPAGGQIPLSAASQLSAQLSAYVDDYGSLTSVRCGDVCAG